MEQLVNGQYSGATADMVAGLRREFLADLAESLATIEAEVAALRRGEGQAADTTEHLRQLAFDLRGQSRNFGLAHLNLVAHRLEDYLEQVDQLSERSLDDALKFVDTLADLVEGRIGEDTDPGTVARRLPAKPQFDASEVQVRESEIMLVMLHGAATRFVQRELQQCGYRVSIVTSVYDALPLVVHGKPDMVIISAIMGELSGIDLALALTAMTETRNTPVALITSFDRDHDSLKHLPDSVPVIRKGQKFGDDLSEALSYHFLL